MRKEENLSPSIKSKVKSYLREKQFIESIRPTRKWCVKTASFDIHKISNPDVGRRDYQKGNQKGFYNVKAYVLSRNGHQCQKCKTKCVGAGLSRESEGYHFRLVVTKTCNSIF